MANASDKSRILQPTQFGYLTRHLIASLKDPSDPKLTGLHFEIQIRTILQHAWAEVEHDSGYKDKDESSDSVRRSFARLAALLEFGDLELESIRLKLKEEHREYLKVLANSSGHVRVTPKALIALRDIGEVKDLDEIIADATGRTIQRDDSTDDRGDATVLAGAFEKLSIGSIDELRRRLSAMQAMLPQFASRLILPEMGKKTLNSGISLMLLFVYLYAHEASQLATAGRRVKYLRGIFEEYPTLGYDSSEKLARRILAAYDGGPLPSRSHSPPRRR